MGKILWANLFVSSCRTELDVLLETQALLLAIVVVNKVTQPRPVPSQLQKAEEVTSPVLAVEKQATLHEIALMEVEAEEVEVEATLLAIVAVNKVTQPKPVQNQLQKEDLPSHVMAAENLVTHHVIVQMEVATGVVDEEVVESHVMVVEKQVTPRVIAQMEETEEEEEEGEEGVLVDDLS